MYCGITLSFAGSRRDTMSFWRNHLKGNRPQAPSPQERGASAKPGRSLEPQRMKIADVSNPCLREQQSGRAARPRRRRGLEQTGRVRSLDVRPDDEESMERFGASPL